jgi:adenosine deaminase
MSSRLPLEVLGMLGPILCWVEGGERPGLQDSWKGDSNSFEERIQSWLVRELPTYSFDSLDEIALLGMDQRDHRRYQRASNNSKKQRSIMAPPEGFNLAFIFKSLCDHYFKWVGNALCICEERMVELHELTLRFPVRHLIQYYHADAVVRGYITLERALELPVQIDKLHTTYQGLRTVVERGLSEGHLHLSGVINADDGWADRLLNISSPAVKKGFASGGGRLLVLGRMAVRLLAVGMLYVRFGICFRGDLPFHLLDRLDWMYQARSPLDDRVTTEGLNKEFMSVFEVLKEKSQIEGKDLADLRWLFELAAPGMHSMWFKKDPGSSCQDMRNLKGARRRIYLLKKLHLTVQQFLVDRNVHCSPKKESAETKHKYLKEFVHQVFTRYIIYHTHHWQKATQSGKTTGLRNFQQFFDAPHRRFSPGGGVEWKGLAMEELSRLKPLRKIEGRLAPPSKGASKYLPWVVAFAEHADNNELEKFGIVIHFKKKNHKRIDAQENVYGMFDLCHGITRRLTRTDAFKLFRLLSSPDPVVPFIVGIDAANLELMTPPEVFAPAFRFLREYPIEIRRQCSTKQALGKSKEVASLVENRRLGMTYHVGEDFRHLLSGLRAIHEYIKFLKPLPGDRLGHAIALGLQPEVWALQTGYQAVMPAIEWLDTLVWIHNLLGAGNDLIGELALEDMIQYYSKKIYGDCILDKSGSCNQGWLPITLYDSWRLRQIDPYSLDRSLKPDEKFQIRLRAEGAEHKRWANVQKKVLDEVNEDIGTTAACTLVRLYWYNPKVRKNGKTTIKVDMKSKKKLWLRLCHQAQAKMQAIIREKQLVLEMNPSSNCIIGPMEKMDEHPVFRLTLDKENRLSRDFHVTINTDDPGVFATSLPHEFYILGEILLNRGVPEPEVVKWLDWLRQNGEDFSFLRDMPDAKDSRIRTILDHLLKRHATLHRRLNGNWKQYVPPDIRAKSNWNYQKKRDSTDQFAKLKAEVEELRKLKKFEPLLKELQEKSKQSKQEQCTET